MLSFAFDSHNINIPCSRQLYDLLCLLLILTDGMCLVWSLNCISSLLYQSISKVLLHFLMKTPLHLSEDAHHPSLHAHLARCNAIWLFSIAGTETRAFLLVKRNTKEICLGANGRMQMSDDFFCSFRCVFGVGLKFWLPRSQ